MLTERPPLCPAGHSYAPDHVPGWLPETVDGWERPGQGYRSDRR